MAENKANASQQAHNVALDVSLTDRGHGENLNNLGQCYARNAMKRNETQKNGV